MHTSRGCVVIRMQDMKALMVCALLLRFKNYKNVHVRHLDMAEERSCHVPKVELPCQY